jgi:hypothetical protein
VDFHDLNEKLLEELGTNWSSLSPILTENFSASNVKNLELEAEALLENRLKNASLIGLKDPRFSQLLPFWQPVFKKLNLKISYIISNRNPLSVAKSLAKRDNFQAEKAYYLWLNHMLLSISHTISEGFLVVDYDNMMNNSTTELERIAHFLGLKFDHTSPLIQDYQSDFLDSSLRHWQFTTDSLAAEDVLPTSVTELYEMLLSLAADRLRPDDPEVTSIFNRIKQSWLALVPGLNLIQSLDMQVERLTLTIEEREEEVTQLKKEILERNQQIEKLNQTDSEKNIQISALRQQCETNTSMINDIFAKYQTNTSMINDIFASRSWRITKPLRFIAEKIR